MDPTTAGALLVSWLLGVPLVFGILDWMQTPRGDRIDREEPRSERERAGMMR